MIYDCRQRKRRRTQANPALPSIHVHNHLPGSSARIHANYDAPVTPPPMSLAPPPTVVKQSPSTPVQHTSSPVQPHHIIDLTNSDDDDDDDEDLEGILYPQIHTLLTELHQEYPDLNFTQYEGVLKRLKLVYISQFVGEQVRERLKGLGVPFGVVNLLFSRAERLMRRTQKLKQED